MMKIKRILAICLLGLLFLTTSNFVLASETNDNETETEVILNKSSVPPVEDPNPKEPIYTTTPPKEVNLLPQTGEILTFFMYAMIGLSLLIFVMGLALNKYSINNVGWGY